mgnify:CR=1 FL=1
MLELDFDRIILKNTGMQGKQHITALDWIRGYVCGIFIWGYRRNGIVFASPLS